MDEGLAVVFGLRFSLSRELDLGHKLLLHNQACVKLLVCLYKLFLDLVE